MTRDGTLGRLAGFLFGWTVLSAEGHLPDSRSGHCAEGCRNDMLNNNVCDDACMNAFCDWDHTDCAE